MIKVSKYEFNDEAQVNSKVEGLGIDEDGNATHSHTVVKLGHITLSPATFDEDGDEVTPAVFSDKYHVDVLWNDLSSHPYGWATYAIDLSTEGSHSFFGVKYIDNKL